MTDLKQRAEALREMLDRPHTDDEWDRNIPERWIKAVETLLRVMEGMPPENDDGHGYEAGFNACRAEILKLMEGE